MSSAKSTKLAAKALQSNPYVKAAPAKAPKAKKEPVAGPSGEQNGSAKKDRRSGQDALRAEILAQGGDEAEFNMLADVDSDSEVEGERAPAVKAGKKGKSTDEIDPALAKELRSLFKSLDFPVVKASLPEPESDEDEVEGRDDDEEDDDEEESEEEEEVKAPAVAPTPVKVKAEVKAEKKESKFEREEKRKVERQAEKEKEQAERAVAREGKAVPKPLVVKSPWVVDPTPQWYSVPLPQLAPAARPSASTLANLQTRATTLLERENTQYASSLAPRAPSSAPPPPNGLSKADQVFIQQILTSGTSSDKVSALLLLVSSAPLHTKAYLEQLVALCKKKSREESGRAVRGVVDWWRGGGGDGGGSPSRKLRAFADQPGLGSLALEWEALEGGNKKKAATITRQEAEQCLVIWAFEDWLKKWFFNVLMALEQMSVDPLPHPRTLAIVHLSNLLRDKPEQEGNILRLLVNKLGDTQRGIASKTSHHLLQILQFHPGMTPILVREVSSLILRPATPAGAHVRFGEKEKPKDNGQDHARYYGVITLNQVMLTKNQSEVAGKMIEVYFEIFGDILGRVAEEEKAEDADAAVAVKSGGEKRKRGGGLIGDKKKGSKGDDKKGEGEVSETDSKLVAAVLTGVNRAFPFAQLDEDAFKARLDTLFRITHTGTFNVSIQALMLIFHVSAAKRAVSDRFYRALYSSLFDPRLAGSNKQALYLNLVLKAMKQDRNTPRVAALIKRLVQVMLGMDVTFILGSIWIVGELMATVPGLRSMLSEPESPERSTRTIAAPDATIDAAPSSRHDEITYDGKKREPQFANAQNSCLWEIAPLLVHYHPSVVLHAEQLLSGAPISASADLEQHSLNHFLDRFVYREVKKNAPTKGSSMMQSGVSGQDRSGRIVMKKGPARGDDAVVNSDVFRKKDVSQVPVDQLFFHQYFSSKSAQSDGKAKASLKRKSRKGKDDDSEDEGSIADLGFSDGEDEPVLELPEESENDEAEDEIWKAMKASMPKKQGDDDSDDPEIDGDSDEDMAAYDYSDSDEEAEAGAADGGFKSAFAEEDEFDDADDDDDNLVENEDDLFGSDEEMPLFGSDDEGKEDDKATSKSQERKKKKRKVGSLPMFATAEDYAHLLGGAAQFDPTVGVALTSRPTIANAKLPVDGAGTFSNYHLAALVVVVPYLLTKFLWTPYFSFKTYYILFLMLSGFPVAIAYWMIMSKISGPVRDNVIMPGKPIEEYLDIKDPELKAKYNGMNKIPLQLFYDSYFEGKIEVKGDLLDVLEYRHDWAVFHMSWNLLRYVFTNLVPDVVMHNVSQDEEQVRDHYDRGDDFYEWFLGTRMIYTSGVIKDLTRKETLEELQDNKLALVCHKLELKPTDTLLDIGCGWGTLSAYANKNFGCDVTGVTLGKNQTAFGNKRILDNGCDTGKARILCKDFRDVGTDKKFSKIVSLEMAEHVGIRRYPQFLKQVYDLLEDDGLFVFQVAGIRTTWQYEDLIWGLFMNKYVFPGADASCALNWVINRLESAGFEVKSVDVLGVHYSATLFRWYENWKTNEDKVKAKYGEKWFRTWLYFLASATIASRQGSASVFQITLHKNLNQYNRVEGVTSHSSLFFEPAKTPVAII